MGAIILGERHFGGLREASNALFANVAQPWAAKEPHD
jgi:hypothetical protein